ARSGAGAAWPDSAGRRRCRRCQAANRWQAARRTSGRDGRPRRGRSPPCSRRAELRWALRRGVSLTGCTAPRLGALAVCGARRAARVVAVCVRGLPPVEARRGLGGVPLGPDAVLVRVTLRNNPERAVSIAPARLDLAPRAAPAAAPLAGAALAAAMAPGPAAE